MGFLDNVTSAVNRGTAAASRGAEKVKLNARISELVKTRQALAAQLGASLYDATKDDPAFTAGRESLYQGIAQCDAEREECQRQIEAIEAAAAEQTSAQVTYKCTACGAKVGANDLFCSGCGAPAEQIRPQGVSGAAAAASPAPAGRTCAACGAAMNEDDMFCMSCGAKAAE